MRKAHIFAYEFLNIDNELYSNSNEFPNHVYSVNCDYMERVGPLCRVDSAKRADCEIAITCTRPTGLSLLITN